MLGLQNGAIRINCVKENFRDLTDYWQLNMHSNNNGNITAIKSSFDNRFIFSAGVDGNIFRYRLNIDRPDDVSDLLQPIPISLDIDEIVDIIDPECLSLEQEKQKQNSDAHQKIIDKRKRRVRDIIGQYEADFRGITKRNKNLLKSQQIALDQFELDDRISEHVQQEFQELLEIERRKIAFDIEKTKIRSKKVTSAFLSSAQNLPISVDGIG